MVIQLVLRQKWVKSKLLLSFLILFMHMVLSQAFSTIHLKVQSASLHCSKM